MRVLVCYRDRMGRIDMTDIAFGGPEGRTEEPSSLQDASCPPKRETNTLTSTYLLRE